MSTFTRLILLMLLAAPGQGIVAELPDYPAEKLSARTYVIHGPTELPNADNQGFMNNPAFVLTDTGVVVIDPGSSVQSGRMVLRQIAKLTDQPVTHVFNSHIHGDHWLGNQAIMEAYPGVRIYAHPEMIAQAEAGEGLRWVTMMEQLTDGATQGTQAVLPTEALSDGKTIHAGGLTFKAYLSAHAHTETDAMIEVVEESVMVTGDNALYRRIGRMDDASFRGNMAAIDRALAVKATHYVPGHGPSGGTEVIEPYRRYLDTVYGEAARLSDEGLADFEMKDEIVEQLGPYQSWSGFDEEVGRHISLAVLEAEQAAFE